MARSAKPRKRKSASQRSKLPRYVVKLHEDDFFDEEDAEVLRFDSFGVYTVVLFITGLLPHKKRSASGVKVAPARTAG